MLPDGPMDECFEHGDHAMPKLLIGKMLGISVDINFSLHLAGIDE